MDHERVSWLEAEPASAAREQEAVPAVAPDLTWNVDTGGWSGRLPLWPFDRSAPPELDAVVGGERLEVRIEYPQSYPMAEPRFEPTDPEPRILMRSMAEWHVLPDGGLCLLQDAVQWDGTGTAADLIPKAAGWFLEYLLMQRGLIEQMTVNSIVNDDSLDHLFTEQNAAANPDGTT